MTKTPEPGDLRSLWQAMPAAPITLSVEELRARAVKFQRKVHRRNRVEYIATAFVVVVFGWYATWPIPATPLWPIANLMIMAGALVVAWNLHRLARASKPPPGADAASLIDFQRAEYVRQRNALKSVWLWYIGPIIPGLIVWFIAVGVGMPNLSPTRAAFGLGGAALAAVIVFGVIILLNLIGAARLQRMIDDLDRDKEQ